MKVKCKYKTGRDLRLYEYKKLEDDLFGRFGVTAHYEYNEITLGKEYLVMGMIMYDSYLAYLIDDNTYIRTVPCQLFEVTDSKLTPEWYFRLTEKGDHIYPQVQAVWGYYELCHDKNSLIDLTDGYEEVEKTYFRRKDEMGKMLEQMEE